MQTNFTAEQLKDPQIARSNQVLRACVHCGFCTATCPTYQVLGDENDGPRGRIYLIKDMLEKDRPADEKTVKHIDRCLSCLACMTTCPSGVHYMHLVDHARAHIEKTYRRPWRDRRAALDAGAHPALSGALPRWRCGARSSAGLPGADAGPRLRAMIGMAPRPCPRRAGGPPAGLPGRGRAQDARGAADRLRAEGARSGDQRGDDPAPDAARRRGRGGRGHGLLRRAGASHGQGSREPWPPPRPTSAPGCGSERRAGWTRWSSTPRAAARRSRITATCCADRPGRGGRHDRASPRRDRGAGDCCPATRLRHAEPRRRGDRRHRCPPQPTRTARRRCGWPITPACSLQHGQKIKTAPKTLLRRAGFEVVEPKDSHLCCGSAGTYNLMQPEISAELKGRKLGALEAKAPRNDRRGQYRLHDAARLGHRRARGAHRRAARLGDRRPAAGKAAPEVRDTA